MFYNSYQSGLFLEIFDAKQSDKKNLNLLKITGQSHVKKLYDKQLKNYIYEVDSNYGSKMHFPKDEKMELGVIQPFLILQMYLPQESQFVLELTLQDLQKNKRKIILTHQTQNLEQKYFFVKIPIDKIIRDKWVNFGIDIISLIEMFKISNYKSLDNIQISGQFKLRKIFTMKQAFFSSDQEYSKIEPIPKSLNFQNSCQYVNQIINLKQILNNVNTPNQEALNISSSNQDMEKLFIQNADKKSMQTQGTNSSKSNLFQINENVPRQNKYINLKSPAQKDLTINSSDKSLSQNSNISNFQKQLQLQIRKTGQKRKTPQKLKNTLNKKKFQEPSNKQNPWNKNENKLITKDAQKYYEKKQKQEEKFNESLMEQTQKFNTLNLQQEMKKLEKTNNDIIITDEEIEDDINESSDSDKDYHNKKNHSISSQNKQQTEKSKINDPQKLEIDDFIQQSQESYNKNNYDIQINEDIQMDDSYQIQVENYLKKTIRPYSPPFLPNQKYSQKTINSISNEFLDSLQNRNKQMNIIFDPVLNCYLDPKTNEYFQQNHE